MISVVFEQQGMLKQKPQLHHKVTPAKRREWLLQTKLTKRYGKGKMPNVGNHQHPALCVNVYRHFDERHRRGFGGGRDAKLNPARLEGIRLRCSIRLVS